MGKKIGRYELGKTLGTGNFSKVKEGVDCESSAKFAIKIIDKEQLAKEHMEEQLKREIAVMKLLRHRNVVQMREVLQTTKHIYLVLELITGGELFDKIAAAKKFEEPQARKYFQQLILGMHYCHRQGIAHRDLKPENLLLDSNDVLKISDFGLSNLQRGGGNPAQGTLMQTVCGTPNYVAPEVLKEKGYNGIIADVWSCGVILFVMLAGYLPFDDANMNALFNKIERGEFRMARSFSEPVRDLISRMILVDPVKRISVEDIIKHPWFQVDFDPALLQDDVIQVSSAQIQTAIASENPDPAAAANAVGSPKAPEPAEQSDDAFEMVRKMLANTFTPLHTTTQGMGRGALRRNFVYASTPIETQRDLTRTLDALRTNPKGKPDSLEVKGFINGKKGLLTFVIVVSATCVPTLSLVDVRRGRGDVSDFQDFFRQLSGALGPNVRSTEVV